MSDSAFSLNTSINLTGVATLVSGHATVTAPSVTSHSNILLTRQNVATNMGVPYISGKNPGASFVIGSTNAFDTGDIFWQIL